MVKTKESRRTSVKEVRTEIGSGLRHDMPIRRFC